MYYEVDGEKRQSATEHIEADTPSDAVAKFRAIHPGYVPRSVCPLDDDGSASDAFDFVADCDGCRQPIFHNEIYAADPDGVYLCDTCVWAARNSASKIGG